MELWSFYDLPSGDTRSRELSGVAWDPQTRLLWAVQDETSCLVALEPDRDLRTWRFARSIPLQIEGPIDIEGLIIVPDGFIVCSEIGPRVVEVDKQGRFKREITIPTRFSEARSNRSLESLTISPSGRYVFTTSEAALERDGAIASPQTGTLVRILRFDRQTGQIASEHAYRTDPIPYENGDWGVSDMAALGDDDVLILERGWSRGHGNTARIYQTTLSAQASCLESERLSAESPLLPKTLRVDLGKLKAQGIREAKQPQPTPLMDNYEGIAVGPRLPDGRPTLFVVSDDNGHDYQVARILVLAL